MLYQEALVKISKEGIKRKLMGVKIDLDKIEMTEEQPLKNGKNIVGYLRSAVYSPRFKKVVGIAMINKPYWKEGQTFTLTHNSLVIGKGKICNLPMK